MAGVPGGCGTGHEGHGENWPAMAGSLRWAVVAGVPGGRGAGTPPGLGADA